MSNYHSSYKNNYPNKRPYYYKGYSKKRFNKSAITDTQLIAGAVGIIVITFLLSLTGGDIKKAAFSIIFLLILVLFIVAGLASFKAWRERKRYRALKISQIDTMRGLEFEKYLVGVLESRGYTGVYVTKSQGDFGADLIAYSGEQKIAIQAKQYNNFKLVGVDAIYQVLGGKDYYECTDTMVITTGLFTEPALELSKKTKTELIDRTILLDWIAEYTK